MTGLISLLSPVESIIKHQAVINAAVKQLAPIGSNKPVSSDSKNQSQILRTLSEGLKETPMDQFEPSSLIPIGSQLVWEHQGQKPNEAFVIEA